MNAQLAQQYNEFKKALEMSEFSVADLMQLLHELCAAGQAPIVAAITGHLRDMLANQNEAMPLSSAVAEAYRRAFCDPAYAPRYGTEFALEDPTSVGNMLGHLAAVLPAIGVSEEQGAQIALALDADMTHTN